MACCLGVGSLTTSSPKATTIFIICPQLSSIQLHDKELVLMYEVWVATDPKGSMK